jgi:anti-sigma factor ChrR (cupin superfamily)
MENPTRTSQSSPDVNPQVWRQWTPDRENRDLLIIRGDDGAWEETGVAGVRVRRLLVDPARNQFTALVRMDAGTSYPRHVHNGPEECLVLEGDIRMGDAVLHAGDYQYAPPDTLHGEQSTENGCLLLISSSLSDELV